MFVVNAITGACENKFDNGGGESTAGATPPDGQGMHFDMNYPLCRAVRLAHWWRVGGPDDGRPITPIDGDPTPRLLPGCHGVNSRTFAGGRFQHLQPDGVRVSVN